MSNKSQRKLLIDMPEHPGVMLYQSGKIAEAMDYCRKHTETDVISRYVLGICLLDWNGGSGYRKQAAEWLVKAEAGGCLPAMLLLARIHYYSEEFQQQHTDHAIDDVLAQMENRAAWLKSCEAMDYEEKHDYQKAFSCLVEARSLGDIDALFMLGQYYLLGCGVQQNIPLAIQHFEIAANQYRHSASMYVLGECYLHGIGKEPDRMQAAKYFQRASAMGHQIAQDKFKLLMEDEDIRAYINSFTPRAKPTPHEKKLTLLTAAVLAGAISLVIICTTPTAAAWGYFGAALSAVLLIAYKLS